MRPADIRHVGVVGAGLMGSGIVEVCARAGLRVTFVEGSDELVAAGRGRVERSIGKAVERGKLDAAAAEEALGRIDAATDLDALADVDLVIEAATEDRDAKAAIFAELGGRTRPEVVLASNTSSIPIGELGAASGRPGNVIGMHFFNPPPVMALLELTPSKDDRGDVRARPGLRERRLGQDLRPIRRPGGLHREPAVDPVPVRRDPPLRVGLRDPRGHRHGDAAGARAPDGTATLSDLIGLDTLLAIGEVLREAFPGDPRYEAPKLLRDLVAQGKLGKKTGAGFTTPEPSRGTPRCRCTPWARRSPRGRSPARGRGGRRRSARCHRHRCGTRSTPPGRTAPCGRRARGGRSGRRGRSPRNAARSTLRTRTRRGVGAGRGRGSRSCAPAAPEPSAVNGRRRDRSSEARPCARTPPIARARAPGRTA